MMPSFVFKIRFLSWGALRVYLTWFFLFGNSHLCIADYVEERKAKQVNIEEYREQRQAKRIRQWTSKTDWFGHGR